MPVSPTAEKLRFTPKNALLSGQNEYLCNLKRKQHPNVCAFDGEWKKQTLTPHRRPF